MTVDSFQTDNFLLEKTLASKRPDLAQNFKLVVFVMNSILNKTTSIFPTFTDHTIRHSLIVLEMANQIIGQDQVSKLNADEIYILMCAAYMHDFGMTISIKDYNEMKEDIIPNGFIEENPDISVSDTIRFFHNYFSEKLIYKYAEIFEFPSDEYTYCIAKVSKGHRKSDLYDESEFDPAYKLPNGNIVRIPYLASILRLCDEMDVTIERNSTIAYAEHADVLNYRSHFAIKQLIIEKDRFVVRIETGEDAIIKFCLNVIEKLEETLNYCIGVTESKTEFEIGQKTIEVLINTLEKKTAVILDSDIGTDDAMAFSLINKMGDFKPDFIIATPGNSNASQAVMNAVALKKMFSIDANIVRGEAPEDITKMAEKNTFHGDDGLAGISGLIMDRYNVKEDDMASCMSMDELKKILYDYDSIIYIAICPLNSFCSLYDDPDLKYKFNRLYIMGGGIKEFNCSHNTEFNFSKAPIAVKRVLSTKLDITLFPLDLTNGQFLSENDIDQMSIEGADPICITLLKHNLKANTEYNNINGAVMHDTMPIMYLCEPDRFKIEEKRIISDEYGAIYEAKEGTPINVAVSVEKDLLKKYISSAIIIE